MNIIIPLGGKGMRFQKEGYTEPKPLIKVLDKEILFYTIDNLSLEKEDKIFIIYNKDLDDYDFKNKIQSKYQWINLIRLEKDTKGASETIYIGLEEIIKKFEYHEKTILLDGDTFYTENILKKFRNSDKKNAVFYTKNYELNPIFSYILMDKNNKIIDIKEKEKITDNANTGAYAFENIFSLYNYAKYVVDNNITIKNECYTSCIIKIMLEKEEFIGIELNEKYVFVLGTPIQVNEYIKNNSYLF